MKRPGLALLGALLLWPAAAGAQAPPSPALASYVQGLDALRQGRYDEGGRDCAHARPISGSRPRR